MDKPRIFLGSSGKQEKLLQALTRGLEDVAHVEPWTTSFNPGTTTLERLLELTREVDFAAFVFAQDDWTTNSPPASDPRDPARLLRETTSSSRPAFSAESSECAEPSSSMRTARSFRPISSASRACGTTKRRAAAEMRVVNQKLRKAIENEGRVARIEGLWWQFSLTERSPREPSAVSLLRISRDRDGALEVAGRSWQEDGTPVREILERSGEGEEGALRASSTTGRENGRCTRTRRSWTGRERSGWSPPIARPGTSRLVRTRTRTSTRGRPASTCAPIRGHEHPGRTRRSATRRVDRRAAEALEVDHRDLGIKATLR